MKNRRNEHQQTTPQAAPQKAACCVTTLAVIGKAVSQARAHKNLTQTELSQACNLSNLWISRLEKGKLKNASLKSLMDVTEAVGLKLSFQI